MERGTPVQTDQLTTISWQPTVLSEHRQRTNLKSNSWTKPTVEIPDCLCGSFIELFVQQIIAECQACYSQPCYSLEFTSVLCWICKKLELDSEWSFPSLASIWCFPCPEHLPCTDDPGRMRWVFLRSPIACLGKQGSWDFERHNHDHKAEPWLKPPSSVSSGYKSLPPCKTCEESVLEKDRCRWVARVGWTSKDPWEEKSRHLTNGPRMISSGSAQLIHRA